MLTEGPLSGTSTNFNAMRYILLYLDLHIEVRIVGF